jgi:hypothetical protein
MLAQTEGRRWLLPAFVCAFIFRRSTPMDFRRSQSEAIAKNPLGSK